MRIQLDIQNNGAVLYYLRDRLKEMHFCVQGNTEQGFAALFNHKSTVCRYFAIDIETRQFYWSSADDVPPFVEPNVIGSVEEAMKLCDFVQQNQDFLQDEKDDIALFDMPQPTGDEWDKLKKVSEELQKVAMEMGHPITVASQKPSYTYPMGGYMGIEPGVVYAPYIPLYKTVDSVSSIGTEAEQKMARVVQKKFKAMLAKKLYGSLGVDYNAEDL